MIDEVFQFPTVKQVIFQIHFPNLFYLENKIGEFQIRIMDEFPDSALSIRQQFVIADYNQDPGQGELKKPVSSESSGTKIWHFKTDKNYALNLTTNSLDITSETHKTYNNPKSDIKFRDIIQYAVDNFISVMAIPTINRIGLRYVDECPVPELSNETYKSLYNTAFPLDRFSINDAQEMDFKALVNRNGYFLRYIESLQWRDSNPFLILDFDCFAQKISADSYLQVTDELHKVVSEEYEATITERLKYFMRTNKV